MKLKTIAMLIARYQRQHHSSATGNPGIARHTHLIPLIKLARVQIAYRPPLFDQWTDQAAIHTGESTIGTQCFVSGAIQLQHTFLNAVRGDMTPNFMAGKTAIALINEGSMEACLLFRCL